ncbi:MAG: membrane-bound O-acyltransferase family protein [Sandaracinus sp.]|nr:membrane-bound O-acyltransferase family protein [Sandaracinus sp.]
MLFHSLDYLLFLALAVAGFWALARHHLVRVSVLFAASCLFYMAWRPEYIVLILGSTVLDWVAGHRIHRASAPRTRKLWLSASLAGNLGLLFTFKYYNFFAVEIGELLTTWGLPVSLPFLEAALPVGISFYTFQTLSYTIDIYRGRLEPAKSFVHFAAFVTYFPQLVAGPIVRASELLPQLQAPPKLDTERLSRGLFLIVTGLVKKVAIADYLALNLVDRVFDQPEMFSGVEVVVALYGFTMQLYCDFSGYTDVARGSAMLMGFELPETFDRPYQATSPADFWRRWHMTLSRWLRDYLYFPLGGSRVGPIRAYFNLGLTMFLVGIWHGWWRNFEVFFWYALLQTGAMVGHRFVFRLMGRQRDASDPLALVAFKVFLNLQFVVFSRILFRAASMENAGAIGARITGGAELLWRHLVGPGLTPEQLAPATSTLQISAGLWLMLLFTFGAHFTPRKLFTSFETFFLRLPAPAQGLAVGLAAALLSLVAAAEAVPYIYFQF